MTTPKQAANPDKYKLPSGSKRFHVMAKPSGSQCNLNCSYCFYLPKEELLQQPKTPRMSESDLDLFVRKYIQAHDSHEVIFTWQGGEPALLGLDFYKRAVELQKKYARKNQKVLNDFQTNGLLLDEEWAKFFKQNKFLIGLSMDGPAEIHDRYRVDKGDRPTHAKVLAAYELLRQYGVATSILTTVTDFAANYAFEIYHYLVDELGVERLQFQPVVEPKSFGHTAPQFWSEDEKPFYGSPATDPKSDNSVVHSWSVSPEAWGNFLIQIFDEWWNHGRGKIFVNWFETMVSWRLGLGSQMCTTSEFCGKAVAIEHEGSLYSCDHYVYPEYKIGNLNQDDLAKVVFAPQQVKFGMDKADALTEYCRKCPYLEDCWGGCPKDRFIRSPQGEQGLHYLCQGFQKFYGHSSQKMDRLALELQRRH